jgi:hypothetical protein
MDVTCWFVLFLGLTLGRIWPPRFSLPIRLLPRTNQNCDSLTTSLPPSGDGAESHSAFGAVRSVFEFSMSKSCDNPSVPDFNRTCAMEEGLQ